jgi:hypothetical protein
VVGLVLVKDLLRLLRRWREADAPRVREAGVRPVTLLPAAAPLYDVLRIFKARALAGALARPGPAWSGLAWARAGVAMGCMHKRYCFWR